MAQIDKIAFFNEFYTACDPDEQLFLDQLVNQVVMKAHQKQAKNFGPDAAKELLVSLVLFKEQQEKDFRRQKALMEKSHANRTFKDCFEP